MKNEKKKRTLREYFIKQLSGIRKEEDTVQNKVKAALVFIYNHTFPENIHKLEAMYAGRFSQIYHLIPGYSGKAHSGATNIISVDDHAFYFHGHVAKAVKAFNAANEITHYLFCADDLILHPHINEYNFADYFQLTANAGYSGTLQYLEQRLQIFNFLSTRFIHERQNIVASKSSKCKNIKCKLLQQLNDIVDCAAHPREIIKFYENANPYFTNTHNGETNASTIHRLFNTFLNTYIDAVSRRTLLYLLHVPLILLCKILTNVHIHIARLPLLNAYSDVFVVPSHKMASFAEHAAYFAQHKLFVEVSIPLIFKLANIATVTETDINYKVYKHPGWSGKFPISHKHCSSIESILENWPRDFLYIHSFKLSQIPLLSSNGNNAEE